MLPDSPESPDLLAAPRMHQSATSEGSVLRKEHQNVDVVT